MNAPSSVISESIDAVEALAQCISKLKGPMRLAATADAHRVFAKAAANLNLGPDATFLWKQAHVAELQRLVEELTVSATRRDMSVVLQSALDVADRLAAYIASLPIECRSAATTAAYDAIANASNLPDSRIVAHQRLALRLGTLAEPAGDHSVVSPSGRIYEVSTPSPVNESLLSQRLGGKKLGT